ncbi:DUF2058 domain-containing protein [Luteimonas deserti]|uniref:DUF2058 family protein n=1 Tax=Luteimonas deserti TaxID=2752306 RepID=A0A7Z0QVI8_9GAMM|nr:DUF2058 family protein [Luteimonas deserti]NYZ64143.1 DUF2058 family protein [Luteimonas deserti]
MTDSLRDQLLGLGFKAPAPAPPKRDGARGRPDERRPHPARPAKGGAPAGPAPRANERRTGPPARKPRPPRDDIDLAKAYAIRAQREKDERIEAERRRQDEARLRREARAKFDAFVKDKALNRADADIARHFEYGGKIKRIHVDAEQLRALNAGELGVVQVNGRYLLVTTAVLDEAAAIFPPGVALRVDPAAPAGDDPYSDPKYQVPDDLVW